MYMKFNPGIVHVFVLSHQPIIAWDSIIEMGGWKADDLVKMRRFLSQSALTSWAMSRMLANQLLSIFLDKPASGIEFLFSERGKPFVFEKKWFFNWSHTDGCVLLAICGFGEVGVDVESLCRSSSDFGGIARGFFTQKEADWVMAEGEAGVARRFLTLFVQKEAYLKMTGEGLSASLRSAESHLALPYHATETSRLFTCGTDSSFISAVRVAGPGMPRFSLFQSEYEVGKGIPPLTSWLESELPL